MKFISKRLVKIIILCNSLFILTSILVPVKCYSQIKDTQVENIENRHPDAVNDNSIKKNMVFLGVFILGTILLILFILLKDNEEKKNYINTVNKKNEELKLAKEGQDKQIIEIKQLNKKLEDSKESFENYITDMLRYASSEDDPEKILNQILQYIGDGSLSDRAYIFEENKKGSFDNTYEWCKKGVTSEIKNLQNIPYENVVEVWYDRFDKNHNILIYDIEEYKNESIEMYDLLKPQNINTLVAGPINVGDKVIGFFGVDNPPVESMEKISKLFDFIEFIFSMMIRIRNNTRVIEDSAIHDQMTGCKNRKALDWAYNGNFDVTKPFAILMGDMNGLKEVNDKLGHEEGDKFICRTGEVLSLVFGEDNVYRMGGDEFAIVLVNKTRQRVEELLGLCKLQTGTTLCFGLGYADQMTMSFEELLRQADEDMYKQKDLFYQDKRRYR